MSAGPTPAIPDPVYNPRVELADTMPHIREYHAWRFGHYPYSDRTVAPWECRPCKENGTKNVF